MPQFTIEQAMRIAVEHHQAGRLHEAEQLYRQILEQQPQHVDAVHYLGVLAHQAGRTDVALALVRQAIALRPDYAEARSNLGIFLQKSGQIDDAIIAFRQAIAIQPGYADAYYNLGNSLRDNEQTDEAIIAFRHAIDLRHNYPEAHNNLGTALGNKGRFDEAITTLREAIALNPNLPQVYINLGIVLRNSGRFDDAIASYHRAIALQPSDADAYDYLGNALKDKGQLDDAIAAHHQALALNPRSSAAHSNLGNALLAKDRLDEAIISYRRAISLKPNFVDAYNNLGNALKTKGQLDDAVIACYQAIALKSDFADAHNNLGNALKDKGQLDDAIAAYRQAVAHNPNFAAAHSNLVFTMYFHAACDAKIIAEEHQRWNNQHAEPLRRSIQPCCNDCNPNRRLRIGYVSPNFGDHCQSFFMMPLLSAHDREQVKIFCYSDATHHGALTQRLQGYVEQWRNIVGQSDQDVAALMLHDQIDILVDLTMHMAHNRLLVFARKPAPVQICWLAYPGSTGVRTIDYRLSDPYLDPPGVNESVYSERTIRLPDSFWCFDPLEGRHIPVNSLPASTNGIVTFGCLNNFCKVNDEILSLWMQILRQVEGSRLLLLAQQGSHRQRTLDRFRQNGIDSARIEFIPHQPYHQYLKSYHRIDLGLDSFPYNGHTTSLDSFWMGVPVVTLVGTRAVSRAGWCQLSNLGLTELAGHTSEQFVQIAADLARDIPRLQLLRSNLRQKMEQSPLMDSPRFARNIEAAYRNMWRNWCEANNQPTDKST